MHSGLLAPNRWTQIKVASLETHLEEQLKEFCWTRAEKEKAADRITLGHHFLRNPG